VVVWLSRARRIIYRFNLFSHPDAFCHNPGFSFGSLVGVTDGTTVCTTLGEVLARFLLGVRRSFGAVAAVESVFTMRFFDA
jgi:hypothetical protein